MADTSLSRPYPALGGRVLRRPRLLAGRLPTGEARQRILWRALWSPFWLGSDVPAPSLPARESAAPAALGLAGEVVVKGLDQIRRRLWLRHALNVVARAVWLSLAVGCVWLLVELAGGPALNPVGLAWIAAVIGVLGIVFAVFTRPSQRQTARMLDRSFGLHERMGTAVDHLGRGVPKEGERASVVYLQTADAANVVAELRRHRTLGFRLPVREIVLAVFFGLLMAALYFLRGVGGDIAPVAAGSVPAFTPAVERPPEPDPAAAAAAEAAELAPTVEEVQRRAERSNQAQRDLQTLARALEDHAVTRTAAEAIGRGDYQAAANDLQDLAPNADDLSPQAREELARDLDEAAARMSPGGENLSGASQEAAGGLRQGEQAAQEGVRALGEAVERTGGEVASQQELAEQMRQAEAAEAQGQQGQPGEQGQRGRESAGQSGQQGEPGDQQAGEAQAGEGAAGEPGEPGDGAAAQPGEPGEAGEGQPGQGQPGQAGQPGGERGQPGEDGQGGQPGGEGQPGQGGEAAEGEGPQSEQGGGAGRGESRQDGSDSSTGAAAGEGEQAAQGAPAEQRVTEGSGERAETGEPDPITETITLPPGSGGEGVQTANDAGSSRRGTGVGITAGAGTAVQGAVGEAGPDSNRVPPAHRSLVERYFTDVPPAEEE